MKRQFFFITYLVCFSQLAVAQCSEPFFSEYIEGSSSNKALELFNPSDTAINLSDYVVYRFNNGSLFPTDSMGYPNEWLASHDVYVIGNPSANTTIFSQSDTTHTMTFFNGDDAIMLKKISTNDTLDIIGQIGVDPGSGWLVGAGATNNNTLIRKHNVRQGQTNWTVGQTEWDVFPIDWDDSLGTHLYFFPCYFYLTINPFACNSYLSPSGNYTWTTSGVYADTTVGSFLTDTVWTVNLSIGSCANVYVDSSATGNNDGSSWINAFTLLDTALSVALASDTILVAQGTYYPTTGTDRTISFVLQDSVVMLGGYPSGGGARDWENNQTILSGDIGTLNSIGDNSYHVVRGNNGLDSLCVLDGFYITRGKATGSFPDESGAGMYLFSASPTLQHLNIHHNEASGGGGGMFNQNSSPSLSYSVLANNTSSVGGAIYNSGSSFTMFKVDIVNNTASQQGGGGMYNDNSPASLKNVTFYQNVGVKGGGLYNLNSSANLKDVVFDNNFANSLSGGGIYNENSSPNLVQVIFRSNMASQSGGGMFNTSSSSPNLHQTLFAFNGVGPFYDGEAIFGGSPTISNSIIAYDDIFSSGASISHSLVPFNYGGTNNIINFAPAPFFISLSNPKGPDGIWMTADDGLRLKACAPMIDAGTNATLGPSDTLDINGDARVQGGTVDMGPYEGGKLPTQILSTANASDTANTEITDANGWTHYCNCDANNINNSRWLLSLNKNGNHIGHIDSGMQVSVSTNSLYGTNVATDLSTAPYVTADTFFAMNRYWQVTPSSQPTSSVEVRFPYSSTDFTDLQGSQVQLMNHTDMAFFKIDSGYNPHSLTVPSSAYNNYANGTMPDTATWVYTDYTAEIPNGHYAEYAVKSFSGGGGGFGNGTNNGPLPVRYVNFSVYKQGTTDVVKWTTASETNNSHFNVQRSKDGVDFETLAKVTTKAPGGNSTQTLNYNYIDAQPLIGHNYYRLEQVDQDARESYSRIVDIVWLDGQVVKLYPNPTNDLVHIDFSLSASSQTELKLIDMSGRVVKSILSKSVKGMNHTKVSMSELANGVYHIQLLQNGQAVYNSKVRKY